MVMSKQARKQPAASNILIFAFENEKKQLADS